MAKPNRWFAYHMRSRRRSHLSIALATLGHCLPCQAETETSRAHVSVASLREQLASDDGATIAWAAYRAGKHNRKELLVDLRRVLRDLHSESNAQEADRRLHARAIARSVLDAMIMLRAQLPTTELAPWFKAHPTAGFVLAAADAKRHAGLLLKAIESPVKGLRWVAAVNALMPEIPTMVVPHLLATAHVNLQIYVTSPGSFGIRGGSSSRGCGCGGGRRIEGFPPSVYYWLIQEEAGLDWINNKRLVADGPQPISVQRIEYTRKRFGLGHTTSGTDYQGYAIRCLRLLAHLPTEAKGRETLKSTIKRHLPFTDNETFLRDVGLIHAELDDAFGELLGSLKARQLLSPLQASGQHLPITVKLRDHRNDKSVPLPAIPDRSATPRNQGRLPRRR